MKWICKKCVNRCTVSMEVEAELPENCLYKEGSVVPIWEELSPKPEFQKVAFVCVECQKDYVCLEFGSSKGSDPPSSYNRPHLDIPPAWQKTTNYDIVRNVKSKPIEKKEPELMTLQEAIFKMNPGDKFDPLSTAYIPMFMSENKTIIAESIKEPIPLSVCNLGIKGKIIPAEPKVLTANEIVTKITDLDKSNWAEYRKMMYDCAKLGIETGQLKERLNHKELRELLEEWDGSKTVVKHFSERVKKALKNLKPLK